MFSETKENSVKLDFEIITERDSVIHDTKEFYIRDKPKLIATLNDHGCEKCIIELSKNELKEAKISARFENYNDRRFPHFHIKEYTIILPEGHEYKVYQDKFSNSVQKMILQYPLGTIFKITDMVYNFHGYGPPKIELKFMLIDN